MCSYDCVQKSNDLEGEPIRRDEVEVRMKKLKNERAAGRMRLRER